jgi:hypothetical protein
MKKMSISDPIGNSGFLSVKGTPKEPIFIIRHLDGGVPKGERKPSIAKPAEVLEKDVQKKVEPDRHEIDSNAIARSVTLDWRKAYGENKQEP